jgi:KaiC/GvpD/RAD55 family RecA-like ATPase
MEELQMNGKRISTGIHELDALLDGGFKRGRPYLVIGEPGTGKTIFGLQFLHQALKDGEKGLYVAIDEKPGDLVDQAASLGWDLTPHIERKNLLMLDASALITARVSDISAKNDVQKIIVELNNHIAKSGATRVVIDPVGPLIHASDSLAKAQDQARMLISSLQKNSETTTLITSQSLGRGTRGIEEYLVAGTIVLELELANSRFLRTITIEKMRSTPLEPAQYLFHIAPEIGITMRPSEEILP